MSRVWLPRTMHPLVLGYSLLAFEQSACISAEPAGQNLISIDTDVDVPTLVDRIRIDVYSANGETWIDSRDYAVRSGEKSSSDGRVESASLPLSFALIPLADEAEALVRVRGYKTANVRDYRGERSYDESANDVDTNDGCEALPAIRPDGVAQRLGVTAQRMAADTCGTEEVQTTIARAAITISATGLYVVRVARTSPGGSWGDFSQPWLVVTPDCTTCRPILAKAASRKTDRASAVPLEVTVALEPGNYFLLIGNQNAADMEALVTVALPQPVGEAVEAPTQSEPGAEDAESGPRLVIEGIDLTPEQEPEPASAIDRLARISIDSSKDQSTFLGLTGACFGVRSDVSGRRSCVGDPSSLVELPLELSRSGFTKAEAQQASWPSREATRCKHAHPSDDPDRVCVPGGAFMLGDRTVIAEGGDAATPLHVVIIDSFYMDRTEFSAERYRGLLKAGFRGVDVENNMQAIRPEAQDEKANYCNFNMDADSLEPLFPEREKMPLNCISWFGAQTICEAVGGSLPTSAVWEYASAAAGKAEAESLYPWGDDPPDCSDVVYARWLEEATGHTECVAQYGVGTSSIDEVNSRNFDRTPLGITALGGNVAEWTSDSHRPYSEPCWSWSKPNPECTTLVSPLRTVKGGSWRYARSSAKSAARVGVPPSARDNAVGFRCVYPIVSE